MVTGLVTDGERGEWGALNDLNGRSARSPARDRNEVYVTGGIVVEPPDHNIGLARDFQCDSPDLILRLLGQFCDWDAGCTPRSVTEFGDKGASHPACTPAGGFSVDPGLELADVA